jgi:hypothetical protein
VRAAESPRREPGAKESAAKRIYVNITPSLPWEVLTGVVSVSELPLALQELWHVAYFAGRSSRDGEIAQLNHTADRLYTEMCRRPAAPAVDRPSFAELERQRDALYSKGAA